MLKSGAHQLGTCVGMAVIVWMAAGGVAHSDEGATDPGTGSVTCQGAECEVVAVSPGEGGNNGARTPSNSPVTGRDPGPEAPARGAFWSEAEFAKKLYESGMSPQQVADLYGRAPLYVDPETGEPIAMLGSGEENGADTAPGAGPPAPQPSPAQLAQVAVSQLVLPSPSVGTSPSGDQVVSVPTWLWVDGATWGSVSATAAVPGVSVTATAVPVSAEWSMGTGDAVTCAGPGTPYRPGSDPASGSPDCGYTYARSSAGQTGERFPVTVTITWRVSWAGGGQSGVIDGMSTSASTGLRVREVQAVVVAVS